jgi:hypothetical protein
MMKLLILSRSIRTLQKVSKPTPDSFPTLIALLHMSHKYVVPTVRESLVNSLRKAYPTTISGWDAAPWPDLADEQQVRLIDVLQQVELWSFLPTAYHCTTHLSAATILRSPASPTTHEKLLEGGRKQLEMFVDTVMQVLGEHSPKSDCHGPMLCKLAARSLALLWNRAVLATSGYEFSLHWDQLVLIVPVQDHTRICSACLNQCRTAWKIRREANWGRLPSLFHLEDWKALEEKDASWYTEIAHNIG